MQGTLRSSILAAAIGLGVVPSVSLADSVGAGIVAPVTVSRRVAVSDPSASLRAAADWLARGGGGRALDVHLVDGASGVVLASGTSPVAPELDLAAHTVRGTVHWRLELAQDGDAVVARLTDLVHRSDHDGALAVDLGSLTTAADPGVAVCGDVDAVSTTCMRGHRAACVVRTCDEDWRMDAWSGVRGAAIADADALLDALEGVLQAG